MSNQTKMEEFTLRAAPKVAGKKFNVFKMHKDDKISWTEAKMKRENDYQPWQIKLGTGRSAKRFKAVKEGSVGENASYYIFFKPKDSKGPYEVCPIDDWYSMSATSRYKTLTAEEAEQKFEQRNKTLNIFTVMQKKNGDTNEDGGSFSIGGPGAFKVSERDDWDHSGSDSGNSDFDDEDAAAKKKRRKAAKKAKEEPEDAPEEGKEDSDEGDFEQREVDYMSDSSNSPSEASEGGVKDVNDVKGIAEEEALRDLLDTDDEEDAEGSPQKSMKPNRDKNALGTVDLKQDPDGDDGDNSSDDSDDFDVDDDKMDSIFAKKNLAFGVVKQEPKTDQPDYAGSQGGSSLADQQPNAFKRKAEPTPTTSPSTSISPPPAKKPCPADSAPSIDKTIEELIKKYLSRKPVTLKALLQNIKSKLKRIGGATSEMDHQFVNKIADIIKRLNPHRQKIGDSTYLSLNK